MQNEKELLPSEWCLKKSKEAPDGDTAYQYYQMHEMWKKRESVEGALDG